MVDKLESLAAKYRELERELSTPEIFQDQERYRKIAKKHAELEDIVKAFELYKTMLQELGENQELAKDPDPELCEMALAEIATLKVRIAEQERELKQLLTPKDPLDEKNIILEIRAGTGGEEAALFVADVFRMYSRYAELHGWRVEVMNSSDTGTGGFKEIVASVSGTNVYSKLKYESGAHRVQRVPATESQGRQDSVKVYGWDLTSNVIDGIDAGFVGGVVQQDPAGMGKAAIEALAKITAGEAVEPVISVPATIVTKENVDQFRDMFK